jgi:HEPN domain-containing protein
MKTSESNPHDWFRLAADRLRVADSAREHEGITYSGIELLQESVERYLKGYLVAQGWLLERTHDLRKLVDEAGKHDSTFAKFTELAQSLTEQFWAQHYPGDELEDVGTDYDDLRRQAGELIAMILKGVPRA